MELESWQSRFLLSEGYTIPRFLTDMEENSQNIAFSSIDEIISNSEDYEEIIEKVKPLLLDEDKEANESIKNQIRISNRVYIALLKLCGDDDYEDY